MMENNIRDFKGIWIPKEIWLAEELSLQEKVLYVEIDSLDNEKGCFASNDYFAKFFGLSKARVSQLIKSLSDKNLISVDYIYKGNEIEKRIIHCKGIKNIKYVNEDDGIKNSNDGIKNSKPNNIVNNIDSNIEFKSSKDNLNSEYKGAVSTTPTSLVDIKLKLDKSKEVDKSKEEAESVIEYLNDIAGTRYRSGSEANLKNIKARLTEGYSIEDLKKVIDYKYAEWNGTDMQKYLRPETLFRPSKFEGYLNAALTKAPNNPKKLVNHPDSAYGHNVPTAFRDLSEAEQKKVLSGVKF